MTRRRAATTVLALLAALAWAPLGASAAAVNTRAVISPTTGPELTGPTLVVGDAESAAPSAMTAATPAAPEPGPQAPVPAVSPPPASLVAAPAPSAQVSLLSVSGGAKPAASAATAGGAHKTPATRRSTTPGPSSVVRQPAPSNLATSRPAPVDSARLDPPVTLNWLGAVVIGLLLVGSMSVLVARRRREAALAGGRGRGADVAYPTASPHTPERRRSDRLTGGLGEPPARPARLQPADDPILRAMGLGPDAPASQGARGLRAQSRRVGQGPVERPRPGAPPSPDD
jgi:hypothetical protein